MYSIERKAEIIKFLEQDGTIEVSAMADYFDTSKETIRRDLKDLETQGILTRTHGGAVSTHIKNRANDGIQEYPVAIRGIQNYALKQDICKYAVSFIEDGDTIFVDNSSTSMYLVQFLPAELHVTFITNSLKFLAEASKFDCSNKLFICLGGVFNPSNLSTYDTASLLSGNESAKLAFSAFTDGIWAVVFWVGAVGIGFGIPLIASLIAGKNTESKVSFYFAGTCAIGGMMCLRLFILYAGQMNTIV